MSEEIQYKIGEPKPLTREDIDRTIERMFRPRKPLPPPSTVFDFELAAKHKIRYCWDGNIILMGCGEMRRARKLGVVKNVSKE